MKKTVIICVPVYKTELNFFEKISLQQLAKVLSDYPKVFVAPKSLKINYGSLYSQWGVEYFEDSFFEGTAAYSHLLLSEVFYRRFSDYQFLLIYQLDAFVFSDKLLQFCAMGYDFIGAPAAKELTLYRRMGCWIGNGGFSLRKIDSAIKVVRQKDTLCKHHPLGQLFCNAEDLFFTYCSTVKKLQFHVPDVRTALNFSVEFDVSHAFKNIRKRVPFGCHGWYVRNYDFWKLLIEEQGYELPLNGIGECIGNAQDAKKSYVIKYLSRRIIKNGNLFVLQKNVYHIIKLSVQYSIWGYGDDGQRCLAMLLKSGVSIKAIYDKNAPSNKSFLQGIPFQQPDFNAIQKREGIILVATRKYENIIAMQLMQLGLEPQRDFILYSKLEAKIIKEYYHQY